MVPAGLWGSHTLSQSGSGARRWFDLASHGPVRADAGNVLLTAEGDEPGSLVEGQGPEAGRAPDEPTALRAHVLKQARQDPASESRTPQISACGHSPHPPGPRVAFVPLGLLG